MDYNIIKTIDWLECKELFTALAAKSLGRPVNPRPQDFSEFVMAYPCASRRRLYTFLDEAIKGRSFRNVTDEIIERENVCLFSTDPSTALEIILRHLKFLSTGKKIRTSWAYLDTEKKAVVHFVNKGGWYAEAFFPSKVSSSALHLVTVDKEATFIPVFFGDISKVLSKITLTGSSVLQDYLPRDTGNLLNKRSHRQSEAARKHSANKTAQKPSAGGQDGYEGQNRWRDTL